MTVAFVNSTYHFSVTSTNTGTEPTNVVQGDFLLAICGATTVPSGPVGWTKILTDGVSSATNANVWYIIRGASAPSYVWTNATGGSDLDIAAWRGARIIPDITGKSANGSAVAPSVTTTVANCMLVCLYSDGTDSTVTVPSGMTKRSQNGTGTFLYIAELQLGAAGATGTKTFTTTTDPGAAWSVALAPAASTSAPQNNPMRIWRGRRR